MTPLAAANIESDVIRQITSRFGSAGPSRDESIAAVDYDWRQCHHYSPDLLAKIKELAEKAAGALAEKLTNLFHAKPDIATDPPEQLFARELSEGEGAAPSWMLHFKSSKGKTCGYLGLGSETAMKWVALLLGDDNSKKEASAVLSELEETLLMDIATTIGQSFAKSVAAAGGAAIAPAAQSEKVSNHQLDAFADVCRVTFSVKAGEAASKMDIALLCEVLDPAVGMEIKAGAEAPEKTRSTMIEAMKSSTLAIDTLLGHASIRIKDMAELKAGDVIVLEKTVGEPIDVFINGKALCRGQLAAYEGRYAIVAEKINKMTAKK
jgi:flagellar motor switch protein FliN/FliY